jgi:hypothetical protein
MFGWAMAALANEGLGAKRRDSVASVLIGSCSDIFVLCGCGLQTATNPAPEFWVQNILPFACEYLDK